MTPKSVQRIGESLDVRGTGFNSRPRLNSSVFPSIQIGRIDKLSSNSLGNTGSSYWGKAAGVSSSLHPQVLYRGTDKSLARPGRKQTNVSVRMAWISFGALPCKKKKKTWQLASRCCWNRARSWDASELVSFLVGVKDLSAPQYGAIVPLPNMELPAWISVNEAQWPIFNPDILLSTLHVALSKWQTKFQTHTKQQQAKLISYIQSLRANPLNAELNLICHLLALLGAHHILHVSKIRVKDRWLEWNTEEVKIHNWAVGNMARLNPLPANVENMVSSE